MRFKSVALVRGSRTRQPSSRVSHVAVMIASVAVLALADAATRGAMAADLGGNCCSELEEPPSSELVGTTVTKGNRKVRLTISADVGGDCCADLLESTQTQKFFNPLRAVAGDDRFVTEAEVLAWAAVVGLQVPTFELQRVLGTVTANGGGTRTGGMDVEHVIAQFKLRDVRDPRPIWEYPGDNDIEVVNSAVSRTIEVHSGSGDISVVVGPDAVTTNRSRQFDDWAAIWASSNTGNVSVVNHGSIIHFSDGVFAAIRAFSNGASVEVVNTGGMRVVGDYGNAIHAESEANRRVFVDISGNITTSGDNSTAISASGSNGDADEYGAGRPDVEVRNSGFIRVEGRDSAGIVAVAATGTSETATTGRFLTPANVADSGTVRVTSSGIIEAKGENSFGIVAGNYGGVAYVTITAGTVTGGSGFKGVKLARDEDAGQTVQTGAAGVLLSGGRADAFNVLTNAGTITAENGLAITVLEGPLTFSRRHPATGEWFDATVDITTGKNKILNSGRIIGDIQLGAGVDVIENSGLITGDILMGAGANVLTNAMGGELRGSRIDAGAGNTFTNAGDLNPGGTGTTQKTVVVGNFVQTASGKLLVDINDATALKSDLVEVTGRATLAGLVVPNVVNINDTIRSEYKIVTAAGGATDTGLAANPGSVTISDTLGFDFGIEFRSGNDVFLTATRQKSMQEVADEAATTQQGTQSANFLSLGSTLHGAEQSGGGGLTGIINTLRLSPDSTAAAATLNQLIPQGQGGQVAATQNSGAAFGNAMLSCAERDGEYAYTREGKCYWGKLSARRLDRDPSAGGAGVKEDGVELSGGVQVALQDQLRLGFALGFEDVSSESRTSTQRLGTSEGDRFNAGVVLKNQWGPINAYLNLAGSYGAYDHKRFVNIGAAGGTALSDQDVTAGIIRLRLSYLNDMGAWYMKPLVDLNATYVRRDGYTETGAGAANLIVASADDWLLSVMPAIEFGGQWTDGAGTIWRPFVRAGVSLFADDEVSLTANFSAAPAGVQPFVVTSEIGRVFADVEAGVQVLSAAGFNLRTSYEGRFGENTTQHQGSIKLAVPF